MDGQQPEGTDKTNPPDDEYQAASRAAAEYEEYSKHAAAYTSPKKHRVRKMLIIVGILLLLAAGGFGAYWLFLRDTGVDAADNTTSQNGSEQPPRPEPANITTKTEHYVSDTFMLEFDHPEDWTVTETAGSGRLTVQSPALQLKDASGKDMTGQILFTIRNKQQPLSEFDAGNAVAARESEKIDYTKPSSVQRGSTYVSFLRYASSSKGLDGAYITGDVGYQAGQAIPAADFTPVDPIISITFARCADTACREAGTPASVDDSIWMDSTFGGPLKAMLQSLTIN